MHMYKHCAHVCLSAGLCVCAGIWKGTCVYMDSFIDIPLHTSACMCIDIYLLPHVLGSLPS